MAIWPGACPVEAWTPCAVASLIPGAIEIRPESTPASRRTLSPIKVQSICLLCSEAYRVKQSPEHTYTRIQPRTTAVASSEKRPCIIAPSNLASSCSFVSRNSGSIRWLQWMHSARMCGKPRHLRTCPGMMKLSSGIHVGDPIVVMSDMVEAGRRKV